MTAAILSTLWPYLAMAGAAALAVFGAFMRRSGRNAEKAKQVAAEAKARDIRDQVDNDVGSMSQEQVRAELAKRARP